MLPRPIRSPLAARLLAALLLLGFPSIPTTLRLAVWLGQAWSQLPDRTDRADLSRGSRGSHGSRPIVRVTGGPGIGSSVILDPNGGGPGSGSGGAPAPGPH